MARLCEHCGVAFADGAFHACYDNHPPPTGLKFDIGKPDWSLLPSDALVEIIRVYEFGCRKYGRGNWKKGLLYSRIFAAIMRHLWAWWRGEERDEESGLRHLAQAAWGCITLLEYSRIQGLYAKFDDREYEHDNKEEAEATSAGRKDVQDQDRMRRPVRYGERG